MGWVRVQYGFDLNPFFFPTKIIEKPNIVKKSVLWPVMTPSGNARIRSAFSAWHFSTPQGSSTSCFELNSCIHWGSPCDATRWGPLVPASQRFPMPMGSLLVAPAFQGSASSYPPASRRTILQKAAGRPWAGAMACAFEFSNKLKVWWASEGKSVSVQFKKL